MKTLKKILRFPFQALCVVVGIVATIILSPIVLFAFFYSWLFDDEEEV